MIWLERDSKDPYMMNLYYEHFSPTKKARVTKAACAHIDDATSLLGLKFSEVDELFDNNPRVELEIKIKQEENDD